MNVFTLALCMSVCITTSVSAADKALKPVFTDLNGDGKKEKITITSATDPHEYLKHTLHIDKAAIELDAYDVGALKVVDIDRTDKIKEIDLVVYIGGDLIHHAIYRYDGSGIKEIAELAGGIKYLGNGIVLNDTWNGYFYITEKYVLNKERKLDAVPQEIYYVGKVSKVNKTFPIYYSRTSSKVVANLEVNSKITIVGCSLKTIEEEIVVPDWVLIKTQHGLLGWAKLEAVCQYVDGMMLAG